MKAGNKPWRTPRPAIPHRLLAREHGAAFRSCSAADELQINKPAAPSPVKLPDRFPDQPWKKKADAPV